MWHEPNPVPNGAQFVATNEVLRTVGRMDCMDVFMKPENSSTSCPSQDSNIITADNIKCNAISTYVSSVLSITVSVFMALLYCL